MPSLVGIQERGRERDKTTSEERRERLKTQSIKLSYPSKGSTSISSGSLMLERPGSLLTRSTVSFLLPSTAASDSCAGATPPPAGKLKTNQNPNDTHILRARCSYLVPGYRVPLKQRDRGTKVQTVANRVSTSHAV